MYFWRFIYVNKFNSIQYRPVVRENSEFPFGKCPYCMVFKVTVNTELQKFGLKSQK